MKRAMIDYAQRPKHDSFSTPAYAARPLMRYVPRDWTVWEPTDDGTSEIARLLRDNGNKVVSTDKARLDFLEDAPDFHFDCVVTNPPYSIKDDFIFACVKTRKPFALLMPLTALEGVRRGSMFRVMGDKLGLLVLDRRVEFTGGSVWFNTSWFCYDILPRQLMFAELEKEAATA